MSKEPWAEFFSHFETLTLDQLLSISNGLKLMGVVTSGANASKARQDLVDWANTPQKQAVLAHASIAKLEAEGQVAAKNLIWWIGEQPKVGVKSLIDAQQLFIGREKDEAVLRQLCQTNPFQLIIGPSGVGKSTLCREALTEEKMHADGVNWIPLFVETRGRSPGIWSTIRSRFRTLPEFQGINLEGPPESWFQDLSTDGDRRFLLIFDQVDDYFERHKSIFMLDSQPILLEKIRTNPDIHEDSDESKNTIRMEWADLATLAAKEKFHALLVIRDDSPAKEIFSFDVGRSQMASLIDDRRWSLAGISGETVQQYFNSPNVQAAIRQSSNNAEVYIEMANDVGHGLTLPIKLGLALEALQATPVKDVREYRKLGQLDGIIRRHINREIAKASGATHIPISNLLAALSEMVDGTRTRCVDIHRFGAIACPDLGQPHLATVPPPQAVKDVVAQLAIARILRQLTNSDGKTELTLRHDYLAAPIKELHELNYREQEMLDSSAVRHARTQKGADLLSSTDQMRIFWARLKGRVRYGQYRRFALKSLFVSAAKKGALFLVLAAMLYASTFLASKPDHIDPINAEVTRLQVKLGHMTEVSQPFVVVAALYELSASIPEVRIETFRRTLKEPAFGSSNVALLLHSSFGLSDDPQSKMDDPRMFADAINERISTELKMSAIPALFKAYWGLTAKLEAQDIQKDIQKDIQTVFPKLLDFIKSEPDPEVFSEFAQAWGSVDTAIMLKDLPPTVAKQIEELDRTTIQRLANSLVNVTALLDPEDMRRLVVDLTQRMNTDTDSNMKTILAQAYESLRMTVFVKSLRFGEQKKTQLNWKSITVLTKNATKIGSTLDRKDVRELCEALSNRLAREPEALPIPMIAAMQQAISWSKQNDPDYPTELLEKMKAVSNFDSTARLCLEMEHMSLKWEAEHLRPLAAALVERMKIEKECRTISSLGKALGTLDSKLDASDLQTDVAALVQRMETENASCALSALGKSLGILCARIDAPEIQPAVAALVQQMQSETDSHALSELGGALGSLSLKLEAKEIEPAAAALIQRMQSETDSHALSELGSALGSLISILDPKYIQLAVSALLARMATETDSHAQSELGEALGSLSLKLDAKDIQPAAAKLVEQMQTETDSQALSELGRALASLSAKLDIKDVQTFAAALLTRMETEDEIDTYSIADFRDLFGIDKEIFASGTAQIQIHTDSFVDSSLGKAVGMLSSKLDEKELQRGAIAVVARMYTETNSLAISSLSEALGSLCVNLSIHDRLRFHLEALQHPLAIGDVRDVLLKSLRDSGTFGKDQMYAGEEKDLGIWKFVDWAQDPERGGRYKLSLRPQKKELVN